MYEFFAWRSFQNRKQVGAIVGLTGTPYQSGDSTCEQGISKAGNRRMRRLLVELGWCWMRLQPESDVEPMVRAALCDGQRGGTEDRHRGGSTQAADLRCGRYLEHGEIPAGATAGGLAVERLRQGEAGRRPKPAR